MYCVCVKHVVDLDRTVARAGPHDGGTSRAADAPGGPEVGVHAPEEIKIKPIHVARRCAKRLSV